ncbi:hypothetical protein JZ751_022275 [Albula glossodonta]|uniref:Uncharacterized protein n=1 Tax=Albula glossodonta TaxID=121402 RepID=A0A8T2NL40_9TELE|nr:hypothetical protein JZ751_022275 [Albula glossodonta]
MRQSDKQVTCVNANSCKEADRRRTLTLAVNQRGKGKHFCQASAGAPPTLAKHLKNTTFHHELIKCSRRLQRGRQLH